MTAMRRATDDPHHLLEFSCLGPTDAEFECC